MAYLAMLHLHVTPRLSAALRRSAMLLACLSGCPGWHARHWPVHLVKSAGGHPIKLAMG